jgi:hypothetical protein
LADPLAIKPAAFGNLTGGAFGLRMINTTDKAAAFTIEFQPPPGLALAEVSRKVELAVGKAPVETKIGVSLPDASLAEGFYLIPYRLLAADGAAQTGEVVVELRAQSRWWVEQAATIRSIDEAEPGDEPPMGEAAQAELEKAGITTSKDRPEEKPWFVDPAGVFKADRPPSGWRAVTHGASLWVRRFDPAPKSGTVISAATRVFANTDQDAVLKMAFETDCWTWLDGTIVASIDFGVGQGFYPPPTKVLVNGDLVRNTRSNEKQVSKTIPLKKGSNTVLVRFAAAPDARGQLPHVFPLFYDAKTGARIENLVFDMEKKP